LCGAEQAGLSQWVEPRLHQLRHGGEKRVLSEIQRLKKRRGIAGEAIERERNYFAFHAGRMNYQAIARRGWPIGSGAVESACRQKKCRFNAADNFGSHADYDTCARWMKPAAIITGINSGIRSITTVLPRRCTGASDGSCWIPALEDHRLSTLPDLAGQ
jgi:hypothetical protein